MLSSLLLLPRGAVLAVGVALLVAVVVDGGVRRSPRAAKPQHHQLLITEYVSLPQPAVSPLLLAASPIATPVIIGQFTGLAHKVSSGTVTIKDSRTISIKNFNYDGAGPDAYFLVGTGEPNAQGRKIPNENGGYEVLEGYENQDIELLLPADLTWKDVDYLSVYCISFHHNFGYIQIPKGINVPEYQ
ncbi:protein Skeletor, isoforms B/C [Folsomia candida]|uniref:Protein Skeletor, isoforms D/E n=1 Tax=Folsomia candida TaxID=158441 RepID=A0A226D0B5_FOLCA|nr:protein Skeletor, isoforms B/C [Folsomia candida]OXA39012.1 Protein Skeletor, isoforms D/E [Folsomia candida]